MKMFAFLSTFALMSFAQASTLPTATLEQTCKDQAVKIVTGVRESLSHDYSVELSADVVKREATGFSENSEQFTILVSYKAYTGETGPEKYVLVLENITNSQSCDRLVRLESVYKK